MSRLPCSGDLSSVVTGQILPKSGKEADTIFTYSDLENLLNAN